MSPVVFVRMADGVCIYLIASFCRPRTWLVGCVGLPPCLVVKFIF